MAGYEPLVSVIVVTFNSQDDIKGCLGKILESSYKRLEVIVVDNNSFDNTRSEVKKIPQVQLIESPRNLGYAGGNNLGVRLAKGDFIAVVNPDTLVSRDWLRPLVQSISDERVAVCQPKIMLEQNRMLINATGKTSQFLGFEYLTDYRKKDFSQVKKEITSFSGSAFLIRKEIFVKSGGFDKGFFMYCEDNDLSWRLRMLGRKILLVPDSIVYHKYKFLPKQVYQRAQKKFYLLERNRMVMILKNYQSKTILLLLPAIILMELGMNLYFLSKGWFLEKPREYIYLVKSLKTISQKRKVVQRARIISDRKLAEDMKAELDFKEFNNIILKLLVNPFLSVYWKLAKMMI